MNKNKEAASIGFIGIPDEETIATLEKEWGKPIKKMEKKGKIILLVGKGLFKKKIVIPIEKRSYRFIKFLSREAYEYKE